MSNSAGATICAIGMWLVLFVVDGQARRLASMVIEGNIDALLMAGMVILVGWLICWLVFEIFDFYGGNSTKDLIKK